MAGPTGSKSRRRAKVVWVALQNVASLAGLMITAETMIAGQPKKETAMPGEMERMAGYA